MEKEMDTLDLEYVGFWVRVGATLLDSILLLLITGPLLTGVYGTVYWSNDAFIKGPADFLLSWVFPAVAVVIFWIMKQATPGKMAVGARIVDAETGWELTPGQAVVRYLCYFVAILPLCLGIIWVAFDRRKQGWHDKIAGTVVVRRRGPETVAFKNG